MSASDSSSSSAASSSAASVEAAASAPAGAAPAEPPGAAEIFSLPSAINSSTDLPSSSEINLSSFSDSTSIPTEERTEVTSPAVGAVLPELTKRRYAARYFTVRYNVEGDNTNVNDLLVIVQEMKQAGTDAMSVWINEQNHMDACNLSVLRVFGHRVHHIYYVEIHLICFLIFDWNPLLKYQSVRCQACNVSVMYTFCSITQRIHIVEVCLCIASVHLFIIHLLDFQRQIMFMFILMVQKLLASPFLHADLPGHGFCLFYR